VNDGLKYIMIVNFPHRTRVEMLVKGKEGGSCPWAYLINHPAMKTYGGCGGICPPFLTSALDGDE
jgi:hypothetical protein